KGTSRRRGGPVGERTAMYMHIVRDGPGAGPPRRRRIRRCPICWSPFRLDLERELTSGKPPARVAPSFGLAESAARDHLDGGHGLLPGDYPLASWLGTLAAWMGELADDDVRRRERPLVIDHAAIEGRA